MAEDLTSSAPVDGAQVGPVSVFEPVEVIYHADTGGNDAYEARCPKHFRESGPRYWIAEDAKKWKCPSCCALSPEGHDWRVDPHKQYTSYPSRVRHVCAICGEDRTVAVSLPKELTSNDPKDWAKAPPV